MNELKHIIGLYSDRGDDDARRFRGKAGEETGRCTASSTSCRYLECVYSASKESSTVERWKFNIPY